METRETEVEALRRRVTVEERPFTSTTPVIGQLIVWLRSAWNSVATKWYVRPLLQQQNQANQRLVDELVQQATRADQHAELLVEQDREQVRLVRETAVLTSQIRQLNARLRDLDARLATLEDARDE